MVTLVSVCVCASLCSVRWSICAPLCFKRNTMFFFSSFFVRSPIASTVAAIAVALFLLDGLLWCKYCRHCHVKTCIEAFVCVFVVCARPRVAVALGKPINKLKHTLKCTNWEFIISIFCFLLIHVVAVFSSSSFQLFLSTLWFGISMSIVAAAAAAAYVPGNFFIHPLLTIVVSLLLLFLRWPNWLTNDSCPITFLFCCYFFDGTFTNSGGKKLKRSARRWRWRWRCRRHML